MRRLLGQPFWQGALVIAGAYVVFKYLIGYALPVIGISSAPVPSSVILQYMLTVLVGVLLYMSAEEGRWKTFRGPIQEAMVSRDRRTLRGILMVAIPIMVGWLAYQNVKPSFSAPATLRSIHPAPPNEITFRGQPIQLTGLENPLHSTGSMEDHLQLGQEIYVKNCVPCHGDLLDGSGHFAQAFSPVPADFTNSGTLPMLTESFVFWRITKGGPGLPFEGTPWDSAMPAWENLLDANQIWSVILFLYDQSGFEPRTWEEEEGEGGESD